ncbi:MAG: hypothetical protein ACMUJM_16560 [bacterium]
MLNFWRLLIFLFIVFLSFSMVEIIWGAKCPEEWSRPNPLMDYAPQVIGVYDTIYSQLQESDCRSCHGSGSGMGGGGHGESIAGRHHSLDYPCTYCHETESPKKCGGEIERNCMAVGCHDTYENGWHHLTEESSAGQCDVCHTNIEINGDIPECPPGITIPSPFSCENCHWEQRMPMEGGKPIYGYQDTHHMQFKGNFAGDCFRCHAGNGPYNLSWDLNYNPSWNPNDECLMRYCEKCHSPDSLHAIHTNSVHAWEAVGWHVDSDSCEDVNPTIFRVFEDVLCLGCHED